MSPLDAPAPPAGEEIHLPGPTYVPLINAIGVTIALVGLIMNWYFVGLGLIIFVLSTIRWIRDTRRDLDQLPLDHSAGH